MPEERPTSSRSELILYAEDDPNDAFFFEMAVRRAKLPHPVAVVDDGQAALDWLKGTGRFADRTKCPLPGVLVLDVKMPRKSGFDVLEWVRASETLKDLPVLLLSSSGERRDVEKATELGANGYFTKTASCEDIVQHLARMTA